MGKYFLWYPSQPVQTTGLPLAIDMTLSNSSFYQYRACRGDEAGLQERTGWGFSSLNGVDHGG